MPRRGGVVTRLRRQRLEDRRRPTYIMRFLHVVVFPPLSCGLRRIARMTQRELPNGRG